LLKHGKPGFGLKSPINLGLGPSLREEKCLAMDFLQLSSVRFDIRGINNTHVTFWRKKEEKMFVTLKEQLMQKT